MWGLKLGWRWNGVRLLGVLSLRRGLRYSHRPAQLFLWLSLSGQKGEILLTSTTDLIVCVELEKEEGEAARAQV